MDDQPSKETYNPWTIVNLVFDHLVEHGLHPTLGAAGHPGEPAAELLRALGITPDRRGRRPRHRRVRQTPRRAASATLAARPLSRGLSQIETRGRLEQGCNRITGPRVNPRDRPGVG